MITIRYLGNAQTVHLPSRYEVLRNGKVVGCIGLEMNDVEIRDGKTAGQHAEEIAQRDFS